MARDRAEKPQATVELASLSCGHIPCKSDADVPASAPLALCHGSQSSSSVATDATLFQRCDSRNASASSPVPHTGAMPTTPTRTKAGRLALLRQTVLTGQARAIRERAHLSQREIAHTLGAHPSTVWSWEAGRRLPHGELADRYLVLLDELRGLP